MERHLLVASSLATASKGDARGRKSIQLQEEGITPKGPPLCGVKIDIERFLKKKDQNITKMGLVSSSHLGLLLSKQDIMNGIKKFFNLKQEEVVYLRLYYTGHGHTNGDWAVETTENKEADRISLDQIVTLWENKSQNNKLWLNIYMDSCYSGKWCKRMEEIVSKNKGRQISIYASCNGGQLSYEGPKGGFFSNFLYQKEKSAWDKMKKYQTPVMFRGKGSGKVGSFLTFDTDVLTGQQIVRDKCIEQVFQTFGKKSNVPK